MSTTQTPKPKRRWYQFSLKTLLVVMTVATVSFGGWVQYRRLRAKESRERVAAVEEAVAEIEELGGEVKREYEKRRPSTWLEIQFDDPGPANDPVGVLNVTSVELIDTETTDADLENIEGLTTLDVLRLDHREADNSNITDVGLEHLTGLTILRELWLSGADVTDAGLEHLTGLTELRYLNLAYTKVEGLEHLQGLTSLRWLELFGTDVTDAGLKHLEELTNLQFLTLNYTQVTDEGVKKLKQALPNCEIHR